MNQTSFKKGMVRDQSSIEKQRQTMRENRFKGLHRKALYLILEEAGERECKTCKQTKPLSEFNKNRNAYFAHCKPCAALNAIARETKKYGGTRWQGIYQRYGLTKAQWEDMYATQLGLCAICRKREASAVDHCHESKKVRGLLCNPCNMILGILEADPPIVERFARYLKRYNGAMIHVVTEVRK